MAAPAIFSALSGVVRDALFPPTCLVCHVVTSRTGVLCAACWNRSKFIERPFCEVSGLPFAVDHGEGALSGDAIANPPPYRRARSVAGYAEAPRKLVQLLKYNDRTDLAPWMAEWMVRAGDELLKDCDVIIPVPLHPWRYLSRRYNQSAELARAVGRQSGKTFDPEALVRIRRTKQQVGLGARQREDNVRGAFQVPDQKLIAVSGKTILLIDDVYTTGATINAATKALKKAGAKAVDVLTFARVVPGDYSLEELETI
ncbi:MAG: ComF family protein [Rhizobiaceae bacterium]